MIFKIWSVFALTLNAAHNTKYTAHSIFTSMFAIKVSKQTYTNCEKK